MRARWAVLISGRGSNLSALLEHSDEIDVCYVASSRAGADGLFKARRAGVPTDVLPKKIDWESLHNELLRRRITHLCLAGFMKIVPAAFVEKWTGRLINLHPSLLPKYPGLESIAVAHGAGDDIGVTVHEVDAGVDTGTAISRKTSLKSDEARGYPLALAEFYVHVTEQRLLTRVVRAFGRSL